MSHGAFSTADDNRLCALDRLYSNVKPHAHLETDHTPVYFTGSEELILTYHDGALGI